jgi:hypothetical protein
MRPSTCHRHVRFLPATAQPPPDPPPPRHPATAIRSTRHYFGGTTLHTFASTTAGVHDRTRSREVDAIATPSFLETPWSRRAYAAPALRRFAPWEPLDPESRWAWVDWTGGARPCGGPGWTALRLLAALRGRRFLQPRRVLLLAATTPLRTRASMRALRVESASAGGPKAGPPWAAGHSGAAHCRGGQATAAGHCRERHMKGARGLVMHGSWS